MNENFVIEGPPVRTIEILERTAHYRREPARLSRSSDTIRRLYPQQYLQAKHHKPRQQIVGLGGTSGDDRFWNTVKALWHYENRSGHRQMLAEFISFYCAALFFIFPLLTDT